MELAVTVFSVRSSRRQMELAVTVQMQLAVTVFSLRSLRGKCSSQLPFSASCLYK